MINKTLTIIQEIILLYDAHISLFNRVNYVGQLSLKIDRSYLFENLRNKLQFTKGDIFDIDYTSFYK